MSEPSLFDLEAAPEREPPARSEGRSEGRPEGRTGARRLAFERVAIVRTPGFEEGGFALEGLAPGVNLVYGPNASGKSTTARAIRALLWPRESGVGTYAGVFDLAGERWEIDVDRDRVRHRRAGEPSGPPPLPPAAAADRYSLALHDLLQAGVRGKELAAAVAREAAGGYDVEAAREAAGGKAKASRPQKLFDRYEAASGEVRRLEEGQRETERAARELARWERELAAAREAEARVARIDAALEAVRCRARLAEARDELARFSEASERLTGDEERKLEEHRRRLAEARDDRERLAAEREALRRRLAEARLPDEGLPDGLLETLGERRERAAGREQEIDSTERDLAGARNRREDARSEIGDGATDETLRGLAPGDWREVLDLARRADELAADRVALAGLDEWTSRDGLGILEEEIDRRLSAAGTEARLLQDWLREGAAGWRARGPALAAAVVLAALAVWGGREVAPWLWTLAGVAAALVAWCWLDVSRETGRRRFLEGEHGRLARAERMRFEPDEVARRLGEREAEIARLRVERERVSRRAGLPERRERIERAAVELEAERTAMVERLGLAPVLEAGEPAPLARLVQALGHWREADAEVRAKERSLEECRAQLDRELAAIQGALEEIEGEATEPIPDAATARGALESLERRADAHRQARERLARLEGLRGDDGELARAEREAERAEASIREVFEGLGLLEGDDAGLRRLLDGLDDYRDARRCAEEAETALRLATEKLARSPHDEADDLRDLSEAELETARAEAAARAETRDELVERITRLRAEIERLRHQDALEHALADQAAAADALRADRERETRAVVTGELADWLRERATRRHRPAVLERAAALFARITGGRFRLLDPVGEPPVFRAEDSRTGRTRDLHELSGGRRLQLLVAARMGFVEEQERGVRVPLVLDETLANSDDASAAAQIEAFVELAREGRQVFYFTAQGDEVEKWRTALEESDVAWREIDLEAVHRGEEGDRAPRGSWRPEERSVPSPDGTDRAAYGERLAVPGIDPRRDAGEIHLWHLVEDVNALHDLLSRGIERWGDLETLLRDGAASVPEAGPAVRARGRCVVVLIEAWRIGRGRPVDREALTKSGAVSERFLDEVCDLARELAGSAEALLAALDEGQVSGFRSHKREELAAWLADAGFRDERAVLDRDALRQRALTELADAVAAGELTTFALDELLERIVRGGEGPATPDGSVG